MWIWGRRLLLRYSLRDSRLETPKITLRDGDVALADGILAVAVCEAAAATWFF
jgi:hypothetical protein